MSDDDLREKLIEEMVAQMAGAQLLSDGLKREMERTAWPYVERLMPVVREALADAWDDGAELGYEWNLGVIPRPSNPWKQP